MLKGNQRFDRDTGKLHYLNCHQLLQAHMSYAVYTGD